MGRMGRMGFMGIRGRFDIAERKEDVEGNEQGAGKGVEKKAKSVNINPLC